MYYAPTYVYSMYVWALPCLIALQSLRLSISRSDLTSASGVEVRPCSSSAERSTSSSIRSRTNTNVAKPVSNKPSVGSHSKSWEILHNRTLLPNALNIYHPLYNKEFGECQRPKGSCDQGYGSAGPWGWASLTGFLSCTSLRWKSATHTDTLVCSESRGYSLFQCCT